MEFRPRAYKIFGYSFERCFVEQRIPCRWVSGRFILRVLTRSSSRRPRTSVIRKRIHVASLALCPMFFIGNTKIRQVDSEPK